jgi:hypothetical protein
MSIFTLFLGVAIGIIVYPIASAGIKRVIGRIQRNG